MRPFGQHAQPQLRDDAVLARQRNDVGQRPNCRDLDERGQPVRVTGTRAERLNQLQRDAHTGKVLIGVGAVVTFRVDHREGVRQFGARLVMIRDDQVDAQLPGARRGLAGANAAVDRNDQPRAVLLQTIDGRGLQTVTIPETLWNEMHDVPAKQLQGAAQYDRGRDAVYVVVTMDGDPLFRSDGIADPVDGRRHPREPERIVQIVQPRREESPRVVRCAKAANAQQAGRDSRHAELLREHHRRCVIARNRLPDSLSSH